ncbi:MAG TPA: tRNA 2-thiocytidine biosynthesis TtcA family protein [Ruminococcus sp.]|nr:tRNA 2-thiocytidine biosynthesis TtcA family protein [Ruminococcus sp.]
MQRILGYMRKAINEFGLIQNGDKVCVGVSGGKDSLVLLVGLHRLRSFIGIDFQVCGVTIDPGFGGRAGDYSAVEEMCDSLGIEYHIIRTQIGEIVFDIRKETNPCSLCAHLRRGALQDAALQFGCNKLALGHNMDDTVETFFMNLFNEGRIGCFSPVTFLETKDIYMIRPLVLAPEKDVRRAARREGYPVVASLCPADGHTNRQKTKDFITDMQRKDHGFRERIFGAIRRSDLEGWVGSGK